MASSAVWRKTLLVPLARERLPVPVPEPGGDLPDVVTLVAVLGKGRRPPQELQVSRPDRLAQDAHLAARVVEVILADRLVTHCLEKPGDAVPEDRLPPVADRQGPRRVGADELHHGPVAGSLGVGAERDALGQEPRAARRGNTPEPGKR